MTQQSQIQDQAAFVSQRYNQHWGNVYDAIEGAIQKGETNLNRLINIVLKATLGIPPSDKPRSIFYHQPLYVPYLQSNRFIRDYIIDTVTQHSHDADIIAELGSGWGYNLFNMWLKGSNRSANYFAFEYTEAGRKCTQRLMDYEPGMAISSHAFNYHEPDLSPMSTGTGRCKRAVFFTSHSIEQVQTLKKEVFYQMIQSADQVAALHFEPVGFQFRDMVGRIGSEGVEEKYIKRHKYNENLYELLCELEKEGLLKIDEAVPDIMGVKIFNSTSLIRWHKCGEYR